MQRTRKWQKWYQDWGAAACGAAMLGLVVLAATGTPLESAEGWIVCPPWSLGEGQAHRLTLNGQARWEWLKRSWVVPVARSEALMVLVFLTERWAWEGICLLPWVAWTWKGASLIWPRLRGHWGYRSLGWILERAGQVALLGLAGVWVSQQMQAAAGVSEWALLLGMGLQSIDEPYVAVEEGEEGTYHVQLKGTFELRVDGGVTFYKRMLIIFLGLLEVPGGTRSSRRTRDGRTPFVRQQQLQRGFGVPQPDISRWEAVEDERVRCIYCGTPHVSRKSRKPRWKRYVDDQGEEQVVAVYRYYCHNPACEYQTFTNLPPHLIPYSKWTLSHHLAALQSYEWAHGVYRCSAQMLGVSNEKIYRFTPFPDDAQERIRGKCPLELAGYEVQKLPMAQLFRGLALQWPTSAFQELVPNV